MCTSGQPIIIKLRIIRTSNQSFNQHIKVENAQSGVSRSTRENLYANNFVNGLLWGGNRGWEVGGVGLRKRDFQQSAV